jgi:acrylyl-CoA reductase (NADPH)
MNYKVLRVYRDEKGHRAVFEEVVSKDIPEGYVRIRNEYSSLNYKDALGVTGKGNIYRHYPIVPGIDCAGEVVESKSSSVKVGDKVLVTGYELGMGVDGGFSEYVSVPAKWVVALPKGIDTYKAMCLGTAAFTAALAIHRMEINGLHPEQGPVIVTGSSGGVGSYAINILSDLGYSVTALTSKKEKKEFLTNLGADSILDFNTFEMGSKPLEKGVWAGVVDNLGGELLSCLIRSTKPWGSIASIGLAQGMELTTSVMPFILRGISVLGISSSNVSEKIRSLVWTLLSEKWSPTKLDLITQSVCSIKEIPLISEKMISNLTSGRVVVEIAL